MTKCAPRSGSKDVSTVNKTILLGLKRTGDRQLFSVSAVECPTLILLPLGIKRQEFTAVVVILTILPAASSFSTASQTNHCLFCGVTCFYKKSEYACDQLNWFLRCLVQRLSHCCLKCMDSLFLSHTTSPTEVGHSVAPGVSLNSIWMSPATAAASILWATLTHQFPRSLLRIIVTRRHPILPLYIKGAGVQRHLQDSVPLMDAESRTTGETRRQMNHVLDLIPALTYIAAHRGS